MGSALCRSSESGTVSHCPVQDTNMATGHCMPSQCLCRVGGDEDKGVVGVLAHEGCSLFSLFCFCVNLEHSGQHITTRSLRGTLGGTEKSIL